MSKLVRPSLINPDMKHLCLLLTLALAAFFAHAQAPTPAIHIEFTPEALGKLQAKYPDGNRFFSFIEGRNGRPAVQFTPLVESESTVSFNVIQIPNRPSMMFTDAATFDFWARIDKAQGHDGLVKFKTQRGWLATLLGKSSDRAGIDFTVHALNVDDTFAPGYVSFNLNLALVGCIRNDKLTDIKVGDWFRVTWVFDKKRGIFFYINQQNYMKCYASRPDFTQMNTQDLFFGANGGRYAPITGSIQDVMIYQRALTEQEIKDLP